MAGKVQAFAAYDAKLTNDRWSWSAKTRSGEIILTFWDDDFSEGGRVYNTFDSPTLDKWVAALGNRERIKHLKWARDNCDGHLRAVILTAADAKAIPRRIANACARKDICMKLVQLNEATGEFSAERIACGPDTAAQS